MPLLMPDLDCGALVAELVQCTRRGEEVFLNLPMLFPSGTAVTVRVVRTGSNYIVSDNGFAYRELEAVGAERSFGRNASLLATEYSVNRNARAFSQTASPETLYRAVCDVATASWKLVDRVYSRLPDEDEEQIAEFLRERLDKLFGVDRVSSDPIRGASTSEWEMTAVVRIQEHRTVFQAVSEYAASIYRTNSAFHDLAALDDSPSLVAVVRDKVALGTRFALLAQVAHVIQQDHPDDAIMRLAA